MARSQLTELADDLITDSGSVLWSFIKGEQLEFPVTMNFVADVTLGYTYEAVVIEALNVVNSDEKPTAIQPSGVQTVLTVRTPVKRGNWDSASAYNMEEVVYYGAKYYKLSTGVARINSTTPNSDPLWIETTLNKIYIQFPSTLSSTWAVSPAVNASVYGFFELRVTEPNNSIFRRTWKPIRGMVEILFSPTEIVAG